MTNLESNRPCSLVTGGAGFIASHVASHCLKLGHDVVVLDDMSGGFLDRVPQGAELIEGSVTDPALVALAFRQHRFHYVYRVAAYAAVGLSHFIRRFNYATNLLGTVNVIDEAVRNQAKCTVFASLAASLFSTTVVIGGLTDTYASLLPTIAARSVAIRGVLL